MNNTVKYFYGTTELQFIRPVSNAKFDELGGHRNRSNYYDSFNRLVGSFGGVVYPVERRIEYKDRPSLHKCDGRCMSAKGHTCECSCGGANHGVNR